MTNDLLGISVIIPCYNDSYFIEEAIDSVSNIEKADIEIIVVDDGSSPTTKEVLRELHPRMDKLIEQKNLGVSNARNTGIKNASKPIIVVLDSDDYFDDQFLLKAYSVITNNPEIKIVTSHARRFNDHGTIDIIKPTNADLVDFLKYNAAVGVMFRKNDWDRVGGYDEHMVKGFEDWEFYIRLLKEGGISYSIPEVLFHYRIRKESRTKFANKYRMDLMQYIWGKHKDLYTQHLEEILLFYLNQVELARHSEQKFRQKAEFKIGSLIFSPIRWLQKIFK